MLLEFFNALLCSVKVTENIALLHRNDEIYAGEWLLWMAQLCSPKWRYTVEESSTSHSTADREREWDKFIRSENWVYDAAIRAKFERNENLFSKLFFSSNFSDSAVAAASLLLLLLRWIASHCIRLWALVWLVHNAARSSSTGEKCEKCYNNSVCELEQVEEIQILQNAIFYNF